MDGSPAPMDRPQSVGVQPQDLVSPLTGLGQIMFQDSPSTGAFFLAGIAIASPLMAAGAALAHVAPKLLAEVAGHVAADVPTEVVVAAPAAVEARLVGAVKIVPEIEHGGWFLSCGCMDGARRLALDHDISR